MTNKEELKKLASIIMERFNSQKYAIEMVKWAAIKEERPRKMIAYLESDQSIKKSDIQYKMCQIVADECM